ncbi:DUF3592 domain-containing protein [bacterium]|nr:DUF3592 domain-containing protein [bacterium]
MRNFENLSNPPRVLTILEKLTIMFNGVFAQIGWIFIAFSIPFVFAFVLQSEVMTLIKFKGDIKETTGKLIKTEATSAKINKQSVFEYKFEFVDQNGSKQSGLSYGFYGERPQTDSVTVEYVSDNPTLSRIKGMKREIFDIWVLFVLIFPLIGFIFVIVSIVLGLKKISLIEKGYLYFGKLVKKQPTNMRVNNRTVYALTFQFEADGSKEEVIAKTHETEELQDEPEEAILFNPITRKGFLWDNIKPALNIDNHGMIRVPFKLYYFIAPIVAIVAIIIALKVMF